LPAACCLSLFAGPPDWVTPLRRAGISSVSSDANFVLIELGTDDEMALKLAVAAKILPVVGVAPARPGLCHHRIHRLARAGRCVSQALGTCYTDGIGTSVVTHVLSGHCIHIMP